MIATPATSALRRRSEAQGLATAPFAPASDLDPVAALRLRRTIRASSPDVVHAHDARAHAVALLALLGSATPLVVTRRVTFPPRGKLKYGNRVSRFVAISRAVAASLLQAGVPERRISIVPSGVPPVDSVNAVDWRARYGWPAETVVCGMAGAMTREKGTADLAGIAAALPRATADACRLVLIGGGADPHAVDLGGVSGAAAGFLEDARAGIAGLDILWHPARAEGLGTVLLDAMALAVPQIAYDVGGVPEVVRHGETGFLVPAGQTRAFAAAVTRLVGDRPLRERLAAGSRERARDFTAARMTDGNLAVYHAVLADATAMGGGTQTRV